MVLQEELTAGSCWSQQWWTSWRGRQGVRRGNPGNIYVAVLMEKKIKIITHRHHSIIKQGDEGFLRSVRLSPFCLVTQLHS